MSEWNAEEFLAGLRALDPSLERAKISRIRIDRERRSVHFRIISDRAPSEAVQSEVLSYVNERVPDSFAGVTATVEKVASDAELIGDFVYNYIRENFRSVGSTVERGDVTAAAADGNGNFTVALTPTSANYFEKNNTIREIAEALGRNFCCAFSGEIAEKEAAATAANALEEYVDDVPTGGEVGFRRLFVHNVVAIDDPGKPNAAVYLADVVRPIDEITVAGKILTVREKVSKKNKPFFLLDIGDGSAEMSGVYFPRQSSLDKIRALKEGDEIIATCSAEYYNDELRLQFRKINRCSFPEGFIPEERPSRPPAPAYSRIFPTPVEEFRQADLFHEDEGVPECLVGKTFVVIDLETTGKNVMTETVTEIGAVKIENGKITEKFSTLVNPERPIPAEITGLTGIDDAAVRGAPTYREVVDDFFRFTYGSVIVAHNIDFDYRLIRRLGREVGYLYDNPSVDTIPFARSAIALDNYKLSTVADYFHFEFRHHRAWADALVTAQIFLELAKIKKTLPIA